MFITPTDLFQANATILAGIIILCAFLTTLMSSALFGNEAEKRGIEYFRGAFWCAIAILSANMIMFNYLDNFEALKLMFATGIIAFVISIYGLLYYAYAKEKSKSKQVSFA